MFKRMLTAAILLGSMQACGKAPAKAALGDSSQAVMPARRAGLWIQTMTRDGAPGRQGAMRMCIDASTDSTISFWGQRLGRGACRRTVTRGADGAYAFTSVCSIPGGGKMRSSGVAMGDFKTSYRIHSESAISGAVLGRMNGRHVTDITGHYDGACPANMAPGDIALGYGVKINVNRLPMIARTLDPG